MEFTQEHEGIRRNVRKFIDTEINPYIDAWEEAGIFPAHELFKKMGDQGYLGINKPAKYGGLGLDYSYQLVFLETLGHIRAGGIPMAIGVQTDMATPALAQFGSEELCNEFLVPTVKGDYVACLGVSEMGLICLPMKSKGVNIARKLDKLGMRSSDTAQIFFEDVRVPQRYRIGEEGEGFTYQIQQFQKERLYAAAAGLIAKERMIEETIAYTGQRKAFGRSILDNQVVHFRLAELKTEVEMLRAITYRAADLMLKGEDVTILASMAKLKSGRLGREISDACLQYWGGMGFMNETSISRSYRDARLGSIGGGADEIMLSIICKHMGILPGKRNR
jgi:citronellyl-CoA dehydrogenase